MVDSVCATATGCHTTTLTGNSVPPVVDCNGVTNGTSVLDSCGVCQSAYIYNFITHIPTFVTNANILVAGVDYDPAQEMIVMPGDPGDPNWNSSCSGCTDATAFNYDSTAIIDDGSCVPIQLGCLDTNAVNYNPGANTDDGSCIYAGCTDPLASNYNASATVDDGSCSYPLTVTTTVCNSASSVMMTGPWWNWDPTDNGPWVDIHI